MARLIVKGTDLEVELGAGEAVKVGRDASNEIPLPDEGKASRRHCQVMGVPSGGTVHYELTDLGATNKTRVNGKAVDRKVLSHGDVIQVGIVEIEFVDEDEMKAMRDAGTEGVCFIEWINKERRGEKVWLKGTRSTFGRRDSSTVPLDDRMASGHHAEIVKDLNGYTVRDMGSTNGTLVNGEPITEAPLSHGTRIRIGNSRFVFKDPSMKDIEVELSQFDEDEGWGMMGDIDLSRARRSWGGILMGAVMLATIGAAAWLFMSESGKDTGSATTGPDNLVADGTFDEDTFSWVIEGDDTGEKGLVGPAKGRSGGGLRAANEHEAGGPAFYALYGERFPALTAQPLHVKAYIRASGEVPAQFVAVWRKRADEKSGATGITLTEVLNVGTKVNATLVKPAWANDVAIGVYLPAGSRATIDDVRVTLGTADDGKPHDLDAPGGVTAAMRSNAGMADLVSNQTVLFAGASPVATTTDGTLLTNFVVDSFDGASAKGRLVGTNADAETSELPATVTWSKSGEDGIDVTIDAPGAASTGLRMGLPREHLSEGVDLLTQTGPKTLAAEAGARVEGVRKVLAGNPRPLQNRPATLVVVSPVTAGEHVSVSLQATRDAALLDAYLMHQGASAALHFVTDSRPLQADAQIRLDEAMALLRTNPGAGITALKAFATEFPFQEALRDAAVKAASTRETKAYADVDELQDALKAFRIFRSEETLAALQVEGDQLAADFPVGDDVASAGSIAQAVDAVRQDAAVERRNYLTKGAGFEIRQLRNTANMLKAETDYEPMSALFWEIIVERLKPLAEAGDAQYQTQLKEAQAVLEDLRSKHEASIPPLPR